MANIFKRRSNAIFRFVLLVLVGGLVGAGGFAEAYKWTSYETESGAPLEQPVPFSHKHHVGGLGLDCRYCHNTVETSASAGFPSTHTCMTCHSQIWHNAKLLEPVRESLRLGKPLAWNRVYRIPHYVYFNHSIHVNKGIGCTSCHGSVDQMPILWREKAFYMRQCLSCHREPEKQLRPLDQVFDPEWHAPADQSFVGSRLVEEYHIPKSRLTDCYTCHR